jgi:hypothetical protein
MKTMRYPKDLLGGSLCWTFVMGSIIFGIVLLILPMKILKKPVAAINIVTLVYGLAELLLHKILASDDAIYEDLTAIWRFLQFI